MQRFGSESLSLIEAKLWDLLAAVDPLALEWAVEAPRGRAQSSNASPPLQAARCGVAESAAESEHELAEAEVVSVLLLRSRVLFERDVFLCLLPRMSDVWDSAFCSLSNVKFGLLMLLRAVRHFSRRGEYTLDAGRAPSGGEDNRRWWHEDVDDDVEMFDCKEGAADEPCW